MPKDDDSLEIQCKDHGKVIWDGHVMCVACGRLYQTNDQNEDYAAPRDCECGVTLMPQSPDLEHKESYFARPVCPLCFEEQAPRAKSYNTPKILGEEGEIKKSDKEAFAALASGMFDNFALFPCLVNGESSTAIVSVTQNDDDKMKIVPYFVSVTPKMLVTDYEGNSPGDDPDKQKH